MTLYMIVFLLGGAIGLCTGWRWGDALLQATRDSAERAENELLAEIVRQRIQISKLIGKEPQ